MRLLEDLSIALEPFDAPMAAAAVHAASRYGKGRSDSKAKLNFGDCCTYATAQILDLPLLFKGDDFQHTNVKRLAEANRLTNFSRPKSPSQELLAKTNTWPKQPKLSPERKRRN